MFDAVIFNWDGTLAETTSAVVASFHMIFDEPSLKFGEGYRKSNVNPKPNAEIFLKCASKLGLQPEQCVVIEDPVFGVRATKAGGMTCVAMFSGTTSKSELKQEQPDIKVASLDEKEVILEFIFFS
jgi:beta-phosphoglucomutase-like phosphatase (HAD superfamily)